MPGEETEQVSVDSVTEDVIAAANWWQQRCFARSKQVDALKRQLTATMTELEALKPADDKPN
jgi:hypothetical protein